MFHFLKGGGKKAEKAEKKENFGQESFEEISEKRTTVAGYFLLVIMAIFLLYFGERIFNDIKQAVRPPALPSACVTDALMKYGLYTNISGANSRVSYYYSRDYYPNGSGGSDYCEKTYGALDKKYKLDSGYEEVKNYLLMNRNLEDEADKISARIRAIQSELSRDEYRYNLSLQEKMAGNEALYNKEELQSSIEVKRGQINDLETSLANVNLKRSELNGQIMPRLRGIKSNYLAAVKEYRILFALYQIQMFGFQLLFILPFFWIAWRKYMSLKKRNSQYAIIAGAVLIASGILMAQILLIFIYRIIPFEWIQIIVELFFYVPYMRYVLYYGAMLLAVGIFGGLVYLIQKKIFDRKIVAIRRLKNGKCPKCEFTVRDTTDYCPKCGTMLRIECGVCRNMRMVHLNFCPFCGISESKHLEAQAAQESAKKEPTAKEPAAKGSVAELPAKADEPEVVPEVPPPAPAKKQRKSSVAAQEQASK